ncbi:MAG: quinohemoprotein amine dehydrogenase subunit alpha [Aromatoleum sp.]|nr:quinohemoprotein amine dehydrogenase subunit alpha [Aromatoleum sp.]
MRHHWTSGLVVCLTLLAATGGAQAFDRESLVWKKCTSCHAATADGRIPRVEDLRTTPEEWTVIVDRMRRLHGMEIRPGEMDRLLKELCATQILAPAEQAKVAYLSLWHNSQQQEVPADKEEEKLFTTCVRCHTAGKIFSYRMTSESWAKLRDFHLYIVPTVVLQMREMKWVPEADAALAYLARKLPYGNAWSAAAPKIDGVWSVFGHEPGKGAYRGEARISDAGNAEYTLTGRLAYADGTSETFAGEATLYGGYALRTRTKNNGFAANGAYIVEGDELRGESHLPAPDFRTSNARWLKSGEAAKVARIVPAFVLKGGKTTLVLEGMNLPDAKAADISFAGGAVKVLAVKRIASGALELTVLSSADKLGVAKVSVKGIDAGTVTLAPQIDYIAITPEMGRARLSGGTHYPAEGVQFEAIAYAKGGGKKATGVPLGPVPATFRLAEEKTRPDDDDLVWLGAIKPNGAYLPMGDYGPNPLRNYSAENSGLVKVLARYPRGAKTFTAEAWLTVTVPDYIPRIR